MSKTKIINLSVKPVRNFLHLRTLLGAIAFTILITGCQYPLPTSDPSTPISAPSPSITVSDGAAVLRRSTSTPTARPTKASSPTAIQAFSQIQPSLLPLPTSQSHILNLNHRFPAFLVLDSSYIYWTESYDSQHIYRYPFAGGRVETIASSRFFDGNVTMIRPERTGDWLVFVDCASSINGCVRRAVNVVTKADTTLFADQKVINWPLPPILSASGDWVASVGIAHSGSCDESIVELENLITHVRRVVDRVCIADHYLWDMPHLSGERLILEKDLPDELGGGSNVWLYNLNTEKLIPLTFDNQSSMPGLSGDWAVWKVGARYQASAMTAIYTLSTQKKQLIQNPVADLKGALPLDPQISGHWLYWTPSALSPWYIFDLVSGKGYIAVSPNQNESIGLGAVIQNDTLAWSRALDFDSASSDHTLEWLFLR